MRAGFAGMLGPELMEGVGGGGVGEAAAAAGESVGAVMVAGNHPTASVLWFWPRHSLSSRLEKKEGEDLVIKPNKKRD